MATKNQQYTGRLYTQAEVDKMVREARIDELESIYDHYTPYRPILDNDTQRSVRRYASGRITELSQTLKEHKD